MESDLSFPKNRFDNNYRRNTYIYIYIFIRASCRTTTNHYTRIKRKRHTGKRNGNRAKSKPRAERYRVYYISPPLHHTEELHARLWISLLFSRLVRYTRILVENITKLTSKTAHCLTSPGYRRTQTNHSKCPRAHVCYAQRATYCKKINTVNQFFVFFVFVFFFVVRGNFHKCFACSNVIHMHCVLY